MLHKMGSDCVDEVDKELAAAQSEYHKWSMVVIIVYFSLLVGLILGIVSFVSIIASMKHIKGNLPIYNMEIVLVVMSVLVGLFVYAVNEREKHKKICKEKVQCKE